MNARDVVPATALVAQGLLQLIWHTVLLPPVVMPIALVLAIALAPMLALIPASLHSGRRVLLVGGIISLLYFCHGVSELFANPNARWLAGIEIAFAAFAIFGLRKHPKPA